MTHIPALTLFNVYKKHPSLSAQHVSMTCSTFYNQVMNKNLRFQIQEVTLQHDSTFLNLFSQLSSQILQTFE